MAHTLAEIDARIAQGPFHPQWDELATNTVPAWWADAKFGIFTHWGVFTVPQFENEWYSRNMYVQGSNAFKHHVATYGPQNKFGYKDFIPLFTAEKFDPDNWLDLIQASGAQYYMPVAEHHDGFQLYKSALSHYNAFEMGPHRDVIGELRKATLARGLHFTLSNHRAEHWFFMSHGKDFDSDIKEPLKKGDFYWPAQPEPKDHFDAKSEPYPTQEYLEDWLLRNCELVDNYQPEMVYFDWWIQHEAFKPYLLKFAAYYYDRAAEWGKQVSICYKNQAMAWGSGIKEMERGGFNSAQPFHWQTDTAIARNSWDYTTTLKYKDAPEILDTLIDTVSNNGNLLLNFGPKADGSIADTDRRILTAIGDWLKDNGEGIDGSHPWELSAEGPTQAAGGTFSDATAPAYTPADFRFTSKKGAIYAYQLAPGDTADATLTTFKTMPAGHEDEGYNGIISRVEQLGVGVVPYVLDETGLHISGQEVTKGMPRGFKIVPE
ncbi:alpha-L-fucosidase [Schleiferilactobacillus shenzhenensis]|uniref:alpha-L-fucosidase n=1 Tax=Schleiferilactobacillus shenzhenensis LY-73 TaxID=1231336 RepID=U4TJA0_9LACO|nr:alpha-L-fucosidase [Schleiferilactobacillus shenzhenensis]ERL64289.1 alpha-L-fucosidase [Schleiferilactobacillus shenzhenensis LY-73]